MQDGPMDPDISGLDAPRAEQYAGYARPIPDDPGGSVPPVAAADTPRVPSVLLAIPADRDYVVLVRSAAAHIAAKLDLGMTDVTDLRLAVDEACGLFLLHPAFNGAEDGGDLECRFEVGPAALRITVSAFVPPAFAPDQEDIGWIMLGALVDELGWDSGGGVGMVTLTKRLTPREH
jgi:serine/threonine-protein kinase RsbW